jgi:beta-lactamase superfamily II metal-dependent hydrolase
MSVVHFLNVLEGDCNIIQHDSTRISVIDVSNAYNEADTEFEKKAKQLKESIFKNRGKPPKIDYQQKKSPDNPINYILNKLGKKNIFRFIITHPDMDHIDGIKDFFESIKVNCFWDTDNNKKIANFEGGGYNQEDWSFYLELRGEKNKSSERRAYLAGHFLNYFDEDSIHILAPTQKLIDEANSTEDYNDSSYVLLYTPPKKDGTKWKILFAGDSHDKTWAFILGNPEYKKMVSNIDVLFAPHHGRDSGRNFDFLKVLSPKITLFGNASSEHLAYDKYPGIRITNNQAGYVIMNIDTEQINLYAKNKEFASNFRKNPKRKLSETSYSTTHDAYLLGFIT